MQGLPGGNTTLDLLHQRPFWKTVRTGKTLGGRHHDQAHLRLEHAVHA